MEDALDSITALPPAAARKTLGGLLKVFSQASEKPLGAHALSEADIGDLGLDAVQVLRECGLLEKGGGVCPDLDAVAQAQELVQCLLESCDLEAEGDGQADCEFVAHDTASEAGGELGKRTDHAVVASGDSSADGKPAHPPAKQADSDQGVAGQRTFCDAGALERVREEHRERGEKFVDVDFPASDSVLFAAQEDATTWKCHHCEARSYLPPTPPLAATKREEAEQEEAFLAIASCSGCGLPAPPEVRARYFHRATQWLRPSQSCEGCSLMYEDIGGKELASRMCTHYVRDVSSKKSIGPWRLFLPDVCPGDVCQGSLGNCWLAAALSALAREQSLVEGLFANKKLSACGAYQVRLCCAGQWKHVLVDGLLPTSQLLEGHLDAANVYYSRGGTLCYMRCERRQLWAPYVEKAMAKVFGCYAALECGTLSEAFALLTGHPTQRLILRPFTSRIAQYKQHVTMASPGGDDEFDEDVLWTRLVSALECGYLVGAGCGLESGKDIHHIINQGLQAPHAYSVLDAREICHGSGPESVRLVRLRNPHGELSPRVWRGKWGPRSGDWAPELREQVGGVKEDSKSQFWMAFEDFKLYFPLVELCRVHHGWHDSRCSLTLPSGAGPGTACCVTVPSTTQVDLALWQERDVSTERVAKGANADVGVAVLRRRKDDSDFELEEYFVRTRADEASGEMMLEAGQQYVIIPVSFGRAREPRALQSTLAVHSAHPVELKVTSSSWSAVALAASQGCKRQGEVKAVAGMPCPGVTTWQLREEWGAILAAENMSTEPAALQVDAANSVGCTSSQGSDPCFVVALPPCTSQVLIALTPKSGAPRCSMALLVQALPRDAAGFALSGEGVHAPLPASGRLEIKEFR